MTKTIVQREQDADQMASDARDFFVRNPMLYRACVQAGHVANDSGHKASARQMIEVTRCIKQLGGYDQFLRFASCFMAVSINRASEEIAIPNAYSAYLTRMLSREGVDVTKGHSKLDGVVRDA